MLLYDYDIKDDTEGHWSAFIFIFLAFQVCL